MVFANKLPMYMKKIIQACKSFSVLFCIYVYLILINSNKCQISFFIALETKAMNKTISLENPIATTWKKQSHNHLWL